MWGGTLFMPWTFVFRAGGTAPPHPRLFGEGGRKTISRRTCTESGGGSKPTTQRKRRRITPYSRTRSGQPEPHNSREITYITRALGQKLRENTAVRGSLLGCTVAFAKAPVETGAGRDRPTCAACTARAAGLAALLRYGMSPDRACKWQVQSGGLGRIAPRGQRSTSGRSSSR